jgi:hypothetical protein
MNIIGMLRKIAAIAGLIWGISIAAGPALAQDLGNPGVLTQFQRLWEIICRMERGMVAMAAIGS